MSEENISYIFALIFLFFGILALITQSNSDPDPVVQANLAIETRYANVLLLIF